MKKLLYLMILSILLPILGASQEVILSEASLVAKNFFYQRQLLHQDIQYHQVEIDNYQICKNIEKNTFYILNMKPIGFVLVSAHKNIIPVLAYSFESSLKKNDQHAAVLAWIKQYENQIEFAIENNNPAINGADSLWEYLITSSPDELRLAENTREVLPMLTSKWNQDLYYNQLCPYDPAGPGDRCVTGCVAIAMAQLCYYFRWPDSGSGSYTYNHPDYGTIAANFGASDYQYNAMVDELSAPCPEAAELIYHMGVSVDMDYGPDGSGMWNHKAAYSLRTYFKYAPETIYLYRDSTNLDWDSTIVAHLDQKIPMYYAGWSVPNVSGHAFIVDGYQTEEYFHFNWGWGGSADGYFYLDNLTPGGSNFNNAQELVINCYPDTINYTYPQMCSGNQIISAYQGTIDDGSGPIFNYEDNSNCSWLIAPQGEHDTVTSITVSFEKMEIVDWDHLSIYDGGDETAPLIGQYTGFDLPEPVSSSGNELFITFQSDEMLKGAGWMLSYLCEIPEWCSGMTTYTEDIDTITDGSGEFYYQNESSCVWMIEPQNVSSVTLFIDEFNTEEQFDRLEVYDGTNYQLLASFSGNYEPNDLPDPVTSNSDKMMLLFKTDLDDTAPGWQVHYESNWSGMNTKKAGNDFIIYPNPAKQKLNIKIVSDVNPNNCVVELIDLFGKYQSFTLSGKFNSISLKDYANGIYLYKIFNDGKLIKVGKLQIQK